MENVKLLLATVFGTVILIAGVVWFLSQGSNAGSSSGEPIIADAQLLVNGARHMKGATESARFTVVEFADFQCPGCASVAPVIEALAAQYPNDVRVVFRHLPLVSIHPNAVPAAKAAEAAAGQGKFWEMHDVLFARQSEWQNKQNAREYFADLATEIELDRDAFLTAYDSSATEDAVMTDLRLAEQLNLSGTPTLFLNGQLMSSSEIYQRIANEVNTPVTPATESTLETSIESSSSAE